MERTMDRVTKRGQARQDMRVEKQPGKEPSNRYIKIQEEVRNTSSMETNGFCPLAVVMTLLSSILRWVRPVPIFIKPLQTLEIDWWKVRPNPLPNPPLPFAGVLASWLAKFVFEVLASDPPLGKKENIAP